MKESAVHLLIASIAVVMIGCQFNPKGFSSADADDSTLPQTNRSAPLNTEETMENITVLVERGEVNLNPPVADVPPQTASGKEFRNPERVRVDGYDDDIMEPGITMIFGIQRTVSIGLLLPEMLHLLAGHIFQVLYLRIKYGLLVVKLEQMQLMMYGIQKME